MTRVRLKRLFSSVSGGAWGSEPEEGEITLPCVRGTDFDYRVLRVDTRTAPARGFSHHDVAKRAARRGDLIIEKSGGGEQQPVGRAVLYDSDGLTMPTNFAARLSPSSDNDPRFVTYLLSALYAAGTTKSSIKQTTGIQNLDLNSFLDTEVDRPSLQDQLAIAAFLDAETARIDALIAKKRRLDEVVRMSLSTLIGTATNEGKPTQVRRLITLRTSGPRGWAERVVPSGVPFVRSANLQIDSLAIKWGNMAFVENTQSPEAERSRVRAGDVLIGITGANTGWVGLAERRHAGGFVSQHVGLVRPRGLDPKWLAYSIFSPSSREQLLGGQYGGTKQQLSLDELAELRVHVPSPKRQRELIARLDRQVVVADQLRDKLRRQIGLLTEHRQALITAAVTGRIEVPGVVAP